MILWISPSTGDEIVIDRGTLTVIPWKRDEPHRKIGGWFVGSHPDSDLRSARNMYGLLERFSHKQQPMWIFFCFGQGCAGLLHIVNQCFGSLSIGFLTPQCPIGRGSFAGIKSYIFCFRIGIVLISGWLSTIIIFPYDVGMRWFFDSIFYIKKKTGEPAIHEPHRRRSTMACLVVIYFCWYSFILYSLINS